MFHYSDSIHQKLIRLLILSIFSIKITMGAIVCEECKLRGDITIGAGTVIHPKAKILAEAGPIIIGEGCLIEELVTIIHK